MQEIKINNYWSLIKNGPKNYTAKRENAEPFGNEVRFYSSLEALERDFGKVDFDKVKDKT